MTDLDPTLEGDAGAALAALRTALDGVPPERAELVLRLAAAAYRRASVERLADPVVAAAIFGEAVDFLDGRPRGTVGLRVFNPTGARDGWSSDGTIVEVSVEDHPFILSTVTEELHRLGLEAVELVHPVIGVEREPDGSIRRILPARGAEQRESFIHVELNRRLPDERLEEIAEPLRRVLGDARLATRDFQTMSQRVRDVADLIRQRAGLAYPAEEVEETAELLTWLLDDHFVLLGYRAYVVHDVDGVPSVEVEPGSGLGILSDESRSAYAEAVPLSELPARLRDGITGGPLLTVARTNRRSTVHRQVRMIYVGVKRVDHTGVVVGEDRFLGLFAQKAFAEPASSIPVLRRKLRQIVEREDIVEHSHDERALRTLFEAFPKHELFAVDIDDLRRTLVSLLDTRRQDRVRVLCHLDPRQSGVSVLVAVPRERFSSELREGVQSLLVSRFDAQGVDYHLSMTERDHALMHFQLHMPRTQLEDVPVDELERAVARLSRSWDDELRDALVAAHGLAEGRRLASRWTGRFPAGYRADTTPAAAVDDIAEMEALLDDDREPRMTLQWLDGGRAVPLRFKLYRCGTGVELSSFLPILESLGFVVVEEVPHDLVADSAEGEAVAVHLHDFGVRLPDGGDVDCERDGPRLAEAAGAMWRGEAEADGLNRLVLHAGLGWRHVAVLRAYRRYRRQVGTSFTEPYQDEALVQHPRVARAIVELFTALFDPQRAADDDEIDDARRAVHDAVEEVERFDQDRILRGLLGMVEATQRTNFYVPRTATRGSDALALKIDSAQVPDMPKPVPYAETFVYGPHVEGVHLRGGPVARGGIRWSERFEDFRAEVLGLMKAQMVKNAVIVPVGAKGGFVCRRAPSDPRALREEVRRQYETYVRALLDITGNVVGGTVVRPPGVRCRDGEDPYLVVAPDKGTAALSDVANAVSEQYGFWLDDAFASGGSRGYDHKGMGITARGAWVAVQRHFRELGTDVQSEPVRVVGIGDMSGDVFGNAMLQSRTLKLVAAFDHRHVFIDPDPDPETSYEERLRLSRLPRSSWNDYDRTRLSAGGGVWSRSAKVIEVSPQARAVLRLDADRVSPPEVVRAILRAPVDLLFAGGIGTFVKARGESHVDVGDRANDQVRVDATELAARVVGEGANLGLTQRARIQYARRGGRCNTDAIDNSAGVDTSDHEVNLKILLGMLIEEGRLDADRRDTLLASVADDVAAAALRNVYLQTWRISEEAPGSAQGMDAYEQLMVDLERPNGEDGQGRTAGRLDRAVEALPSTVEMQRRRDAGAGLTRPELAVLLGYTKVDLRTSLLDSSLVDDPFLHEALAGYFPGPIAQDFDDALERIRLRRELVATVVANDLVNRMGITYANRTAREFGVTPVTVASAYWAARAVCDADRRWRAIEALDGRSEPALQLELKGEVDGLVNAFVRAYLRQGVGERVAEIVERDQPVFRELEKVVAELGSADVRARRRTRADHYIGLGVDDELAEGVVALADLLMVPDVAAVARTADAEVRQVAELFFHLAATLPFDALLQRLQDLDPQGPWERWQQQSLLDELRRVRRTSAVRILRAAGEDGVEQAAAAFVAARADGLGRLSAMIRTLQADPSAGLSAVAVAVTMLRDAAIGDEGV